MKDFNFGVIKNPLLLNFFGTKFRHNNVLSYGTINHNRLVEIDSSGRFAEATVESATVFGVNMGRTVATEKAFDIDFGKVLVEAGTKIPLVGGKLKAMAGGKVAPIIGTQATIKAATAGNFGNQPANDGITVVSDNAADTMKVTVYGTTNGGSVIVSEEITLNGTTPVASAKLDWGIILAVVVAAAHAGTITVAEASASAVVTTLATGTLSKGLDEVAEANQNAFGAIPTVVAGGASTKYVGIEYTKLDGTTGTEVKALNGTTPVSFTNRAIAVTKVFGGDVATATVATVKTAAAESSVASVGIALETGDVGDNIEILLKQAL